ncbi:MAG: hypothetical protein RIC03_00055 [Cyclobacteriaceae bacterium]
MTAWKAITLLELQKQIKNGVDLMTHQQLRIWNQISVQPKKWIEVEYGNNGGGFWVVAIDQDEVVWYNDIEEGFNLSTFAKYGYIDEYGAEQDELQWTMNKLKRHHNNTYE